MIIIKNINKSNIEELVGKEFEHDENNIDWCDASKSETLSFLCKHYNSNRYFDFDCYSLAWDEKSFYSDRGYKIIEWD